MTRFNYFGNLLLPFQPFKVSLCRTTKYEELWNSLFVFHAIGMDKLEGKNTTS